MNFGPQPHYITSQPSDSLHTTSQLINNIIPHHITSSPRKNDGKTTTNHQRERLKKTLVLGSAHEICLNYSVSEESWGLYKSLHQKPATIQMFVSTQLCSTCDGHWIGKDQPLHLLHGCHDQISIGSALIVGRPGNDDSWAERRQFCTFFRKQRCAQECAPLSFWLFLSDKLKMPSCGDLLDS